MKKRLPSSTFGFRFTVFQNDELRLGLRCGWFVPLYCSDYDTAGSFLWVWVGLVGIGGVIGSVVGSALWFVCVCVTWFWCFGLVCGSEPSSVWFNVVLVRVSDFSLVWFVWYGDVRCWILGFVNFFWLCCCVCLSLLLRFNVVVFSKLFLCLFAVLVCRFCVGSLAPCACSRWFLL